MALNIGPRRVIGLSPGKGGGGVPSLPALVTARAAVYGMVKVVPDYTGPLFELFRVADSAALDVYPLASGKPDYAAIDAWAGGATPLVSKRYDQSGNGNHETTSAARRPAFTSIVSANGIRPALIDTYVDASIVAKPKGFIVPSSVAVNRTNFGAFMVLNPRLAYQNAIYFEFSSGGATQLALFQDDNNTLSFTNGSTLRATGKRLVQRAQSISFSGSGADTKIRVDKATTTGAAYAALAMGPTIKDGDSITETSTTTGYFGYHESYFLLIFSSAPTDADILALEAWADSAFALTVTPTQRLVYGGSSLISGLHATLIKTPAWLLGLPLEWETYNFGYGGKTMAQEYANRNSPVAEQAWYDATKAKNVLVIDAPSNDINTATYANQAAAEAAMDAFYAATTVPLVQSAQAKGFSVVVPTCIVRGTITTANFREYARLRYNALVRAGAAANGYQTADRAGDARLSNYANTTYFSPDQIHLEDAGYAILSAIDGAAILAA